MEFGKRMEPTQAPIDEAPASVASGTAAWWHGLATGQRQLIKFFSLVLVVVGFGFVLQASPNPLAWALRKVRPAGPIGAEREIVVNLSLDGVTPDLTRHNAVLRKVCLVAPEPRRIGGKDVPVPRIDPVSGELRVDLLVAAPVLSCLLQRETARLCHKSERTRMVAALRRYAELHAARAARFRTVMNSPAGPFVNLYEDFQDAYTQVDARRLDGQLIDAQLARAVEKASANGYIAARHFGATVPPELAPHILPPVMESCSR